MLLNMIELRTIASDSEVSVKWVDFFYPDHFRSWEREYAGVSPSAEAIMQSMIEDPEAFGIKESRFTLALLNNKGEVLKEYHKQEPVWRPEWCNNPFMPFGEQTEEEKPHLAPSQIICSYSHPDLKWKQPFEAWTTFPNRRLFYRDPITGEIGHAASYDMLEKVLWWFILQYSTFGVPKLAWVPPVSNWELPAVNRKWRPQASAEKCPLFQLPKDVECIFHSNWDAYEKGQDSKESVRVYYTEAHYLLPSGGALIVLWRRQENESSAEAIHMREFAPRQWKLEYYFHRDNHYEGHWRIVPQQEGK